VSVEGFVAECTTELWPPRPIGGQQVGSGPQGVKVTHLPTGVVACCDVGRSQHYNKVIALDMILAALTHPKFGSYAR
jgi:protein subunit release factor A